MKIEITQNNDIVVAAIAGRLDTVTSSDFEKSLTAYFPSPGLELVLDCNAMEYISSAGLRVVLMAHKSIVANGGRFVIRNLTKEVRSVFDMIGFSNILTIE
jgi:anti-anti-sigma factor